MGLKRITAIIEVTYPADDARSFDQLHQSARETAAFGDGGTLAAYVAINGSVDPDAEPSLPETGQ